MLLGSCAEGSTALDAFGLGLLCFCLVFPGLAQGGLYAAPTVSAIDGLFRLPDGPSADNHRAVVYGIMVRDLEKVRRRLVDAALDGVIDPFAFAHLTHLLHHEPSQRLQLLDMRAEEVQALVEGYAQRLGHLRQQRNQESQANGAVVHEVFTFSPPTRPAVGGGRGEDEGQREEQGPEGRGQTGEVSMGHGSLSHSMVRHDVRLFSLDLSGGNEHQSEQPSTSALHQCDYTQASGPQASSTSIAMGKGPTTVSMRQSHSMVRHEVRLFSLDLSGQDEHQCEQPPTSPHDAALPQYDDIQASSTSMDEGPTTVSMRYVRQSHSMVRHDVRLFSLNLSEAGEPQPEQAPTSPHDAVLPQCDDTQGSSTYMVMEEGPTPVSMRHMSNSHSMVRHDVRLFSLDLSEEGEHQSEQPPLMAPTHDDALPAPQATPNGCLQDSYLQESRVIVPFVHEPAAKPGPPPTVEGSGLHLITSLISSLPASPGVEEGGIDSSVYVSSAHASAAANALTGESWMQPRPRRRRHRGGRRRSGGRRHRRRRGARDTKQAATHVHAAATRLAEKERLQLHLQELFLTRKYVPASTRPRRERRRQGRAPGVHRLDGEHLIQVIV